MFTGIVENFASLVSLEGKTLRITNPFANAPLSIGQSIALSGCCLTVIALSSEMIEFDVSPETLEKTKFGQLKKGDRINLERGLKVGDAMDGHWVTGHVDGVVRVKTIESLSDGMKRILFETPPRFYKWLVQKGSIAIDGVSLTVNDVSKETFSVVLIPHTLDVTSLSSLKAGSVANAEYDLFAKYVERLMEARNEK